MPAYGFSLIRIFPYKDKLKTILLRGVSEVEPHKQKIRET